jgi:TrbL/VirB6 plasmid conjugal transfer protein
MSFFNITKFLCVMLCLMCIVMMPSDTFAQQSSDLLDDCTSNNFFSFDDNDVTAAQSVLQDAITEISNAVDTASRDLFEAFVFDGAYRTIINAAFILVVIFFAVSFMFGFVTMTLMQGVIRLVKIGFVLWIASPTGYTVLLEDYFIRFFNEGGTWLINAMINISTQGFIGTPSTDIAAPFAVLDEIIKITFSPRMIVTIIGTFATGPFGPVMGLAMLWAIISIFIAVLKALQIYAISIVIKAVLLGLAPVFIPMILFERTKSMFMGWINQLMNFTLQPILLFAFIAFFSSLIVSAAEDILPPDSAHLCYVKSNTQGGTPFDVKSWKFMCCNAEGGNCLPYEGAWTWKGAKDCPDAPLFPVDHITVLIFLLLTHMMKELTTLAVSVASELSQGMMKLDQIPNAVNDYFGGLAGKGGGGIDEIRHMRK